MLVVTCLLAVQATSPLIVRVRHALSATGPSWPATELSGTANYHGIPHRYDLKFTRDGRFVERIDGQLGDTFGFDGKTYWQIDSSRSLRKLDLADRDWIRAETLALMGSWTSQNPVEDSPTEFHLDLSGPGHREIIDIDPATLLPTKATFPVSTGKVEFGLSDWKPSGRVRVPMRVAIMEAGETDTLSADHISRKGLRSDDFRVPDWKPTDIAFDQSKPAEVESKRAVSHHILVHTFVDGVDAGWFILDSGAGRTVIDKSVADELKLKSIGEIAVRGVGGSAKSSYRLADSITVGPATLSHPVLNELDLSEIGKALGLKVGGVLGSDFFRRTIIEMNPVKPTINVYPRARFDLGAGQTVRWQPIRFSNGHPAVLATADGTPTSWYRFDSGADGTVAFHTAFVDAWKMLDGRKTSEVALGGVGGTVSSQYGKVPWFELFGHRFDSPNVIFSRANRGGLADTYLAGNIGQEFMKHFDVFFDFAGYRIAAIPVQRS